MDATKFLHQQLRHYYGTRNVTFM